MLALGAMGKQTFRVTGKKGFRVTGKWASGFRAPGAPEWARHLGAPWVPVGPWGPSMGRKALLTSSNRQGRRVG